MNNLSHIMQERLDKWRNRAQVVPSPEKARGSSGVNRATKSDYGDVNTQEEWNEEIRRSQTRK